MYYSIGSVVYDTTVNEPVVIVKAASRPDEVWVRDLFDPGPNKLQDVMPLRDLCGWSMSFGGPVAIRER